MRTILHIIKKELIQLRRDPRMFPILFISPILQLLVLGYAANLDVREISTVICDMDNSQTSRNFTAKFTNSGYFSSVGTTKNIKDVDEFIDNGKASLAIVIPLNFGNDILAQRQVQLQIIADGSESNSATIGLQYATQIVLGYSRSIVMQKFSRMKSLGVNNAQIEPEIRVWYNPELKSRNFMVPGILGLLLMVMTMMLTSMAIVKEKEIGTLEQLIVTPIKPYQLIIGKLAPFTLIGLIDVLLVVLVATFLFNIPVKGSIPLLFGLSLVFLMATLGLGLFVSTISSNQQQAMMAATFFVMFPMIYLSGFVFPIENMPQVIQYFTYIIPLRYYFVIIRGLFLKGVGIQELWTQVGALFALGTVILSLSVLRFHKKSA